MFKIDFVDGLIKLLHEKTGLSEAALRENWHTLLEVHKYDFHRAVVDLVASSLWYE